MKQLTETLVVRGIVQMDGDQLRTTIEIVHADNKKGEVKTFVFRLTAEGSAAGEMSISMDKHFPTKVAEQVARTFLYRKLRALAEEAKFGTLSDDELKALWAKYKPEHYPK